jgi:uncharacterized protein YcbX
LTSSAGDSDVARVSALYVYPIKSCAGISVERARVESRGLEFDRRFMVIDGNGRFLTQRQLPKMVLLRTAISGDALSVARPDGERLELPLQPTWPETVRVKVWRSELDACVAAADVNDWFSDYLDRPARLVYMAQHQHRRVSRQRATQPGDEVSFADGAPILLISEGSLAALNAKLAEPVSMQHFRPNVVVDAPEAFVEDRWKHIRISGTDLEVAWRCARCTMTTVDPDAGSMHADAEPLRTLREFRREGPNVMFGQNVLTRGAGRLEVGAKLEVIETN